MSEDLIVRHCAPTLAGLKTGNMFTATFAGKTQLDSEVLHLNQILADKGLRVTVLRIACHASQSKSRNKSRSKASSKASSKCHGTHCGKGCIRALIYIYRPGRLQSDLDVEEAKDILLRFGYEESSLDGCISRLEDRIYECDEFPHEVGLFLGYPPEDVKGFIELGGRNSKASGYWKVYGDVDRAQKQFERFSKCTGVYLECLGRGLPITKLAVNTKITA